jgi:hypothetical protein
MAITSAEATVWHTTAMVAVGVGVWAASTTDAAPSMGQGIEPLQLMMNAKGLATAEFADYTFVFR